MKTLSLAAWSVLVGALVAAGCGEQDSSTENASGSGASGGGGSGSVGGAGGGSSGSAGGGGGAEPCMPGATEACYGGPAGTMGVGVCVGGTRTCKADGSGFGACEGEVLPTPENCATSLDEDCDGATPSCGSDNLWSRRFGAGEGFGLAVDAKGDPILVGRFPGSLSFGGNTLTSSGGYDAFIAKLSGASGEHLWSRRLGGNEDQTAWAVAVDPDGNVVVVGEFLGQMSVGGGNSLTSAGGYDMFVAKYDGMDGDHLWSRRFGDDSDQIARGVAVTKTGEIVVTGSFAGKVDFGAGSLTSAGSFDAFVLTLDADGNTIRQSRYGDSDEQNGRAVAVDTSGSPVVTGDFRGSMDFGATVLTTKGGFDLFVARLDPGGSTVYAKSYGDMNPQRGYAATINAAGHAVVSGIARGNVDFGGGELAAQNLDVFLLELSPSGAHMKSFLMGGKKADSAGGVAIGAEGRYVLVGGFQDAATFGGIEVASKGGLDGFVARYDASGDLVGALGYGDGDDQVMTAVATDAAGRIFVASQVSGGIDFGQGTLWGGTGELALAKLAP